MLPAVPVTLIFAFLGEPPPPSKPASPDRRSVAPRVSAISRPLDHPHGQSLSVAGNGIRIGAGADRIQVAAGCQNLGRVGDGSGPADRRLRLPDPGHGGHQLEQHQCHAGRTRDCSPFRCVNPQLWSWIEPGRPGLVGQSQVLVPNRMAGRNLVVHHLRRNCDRSDLTPIGIVFSVLPGQWRILPFLV